MRINILGININKPLLRIKLKFKDFKDNSKKCKMKIKDFQLLLLNSHKKTEDQKVNLKPHKIIAKNSQPKEIMLKLNMNNVCHKSENLKYKLTTYSTKTQN